ncbi:MAG: MFS transporter [Streptosporangiales bacterium]|nr:MFS transporter [Streptosporangiales bacterium]
MTSQRWARVLPVAFITYSLAYLDRSNYSIGIASGMKGDLGITGGAAALLGALFFLGYFFFQVPAAIYAERRSVRRLIFWSLIAWGILASAQGLVSSVGLLMADRFLLGVVEAAVLPAMVVFLAHWFTTGERASANTFLILGNPATVLWMSVLSGYLIQVTSWRWMFIIEGVPAIIWAFVFRALVTDHPRDAAWLEPAERDQVGAALAAEQRTIAPVSSYRAALRSRNVVLLCAQYLLWSIGVYGLVFWLPSIIKSSTGAAIGMTGLLSAIPYALAVIAMIVTGRLSDRAGRRGVYVWTWLLFAAVAFVASYFAGPHDFWLSFILLILAAAGMYAPYGPYFASITESLPRDSAAPAVALVNAFGGLGGFIGTYLVGWLDSATGTSAASVLFMAATLAVAAAIIPLIRSRTRTAAAAVPSGT